MVSIATVAIIFARGSLGNTIVKRNTSLQGKHPQDPELPFLSEALSITWHMMRNMLNHPWMANKLDRPTVENSSNHREENASQLGRVTNFGNR
jgi:hypothetical protein